MRTCTRARMGAYRIRCYSVLARELEKNLGDKGLKNLLPDFVPVHHFLRIVQNIIYRMQAMCERFQRRRIDTHAI